MAADARVAAAIERVRIVFIYACTTILSLGVEYNPSSMHDSRFVIVAIVTQRSGAFELFREYEIKAAAVMAEYGGAIERTFVEDVSYSEQPPREVHILTFPDRSAFERYRADADMNGSKDLRAACIERTELVIGREGPNYMAPRKGTR